MAERKGLGMFKLVLIIATWSDGITMLDINTGDRGTNASYYFTSLESCKKAGEAARSNFVDDPLAVDLSAPRIMYTCVPS